AGRCDAWTADKSQLAARRASFPKEVGGPDALQLLPVTLSREPLAAATKQDDPAWSELVNWVILGMMLADDTGVTSVNVDEIVARPTSAEVARLLGAPEDGQIFNPGLGLSPGFMRDVIKQVGNYDEVYRRNIEPLGISRRNSPNASYRQGGLMYTPPWR
ncbi:MAG: amino acid ABC transporter substrate-binding protein, partial [Chloroflexota bacterium]